MEAKVRALAVLLATLAALGPLAAAQPGGAPLADEAVAFEDVTASAGFPDRGWTRVAWGDYNGDGWEDLLLNGNALFRNRGDGTFADVTTIAGLGAVASNGGVWADYDNDGDLDFYATVHSFTARDALYRNDGDGTFSDMADLSGDIYDYLPTQGAAWADYDNDGFVDLYVANYENWRQDGDEYGIGTPDILYHNDGDGSFSNATTVAGVELSGEPLCGRGVVWSDYDDDGDQDCYVSNYRLDPNLLWRNDGDGTFTEFARQARAEGYAAEPVPGSEARYGHTIGSDFGDYDNDGDVDLYASNLAHPRFIAFSDKSMLLANRGDGTFVERFYGSGIAYCETSSDPAWGDFDNDGDLDLYFTAVYDGRWSRLFRNTGNGRFDDATDAARASINNGWGCAWCDYDHDGDLDLAVGSGSGFRLLRNRGNPNHWFEVELEGTTCNRAAIGARVRVVAGPLDMVRDVQGGRGTTSQNMLSAHFGLADHTDPVEVWVRWPGERDYLRAGTYEPDQRIVVVQPAGTADAAVSVDIEPPRPTAGEPVAVTAIVSNVGDRHVDTTRVIFDVTGPEPMHYEATVLDIEPGGEITVTAAWQPTTVGTYEVVASLEGTVPADYEPSNDVARSSVQVMGANRAPTANLRVAPTTAPPGLEVTFDGSGSTDDGSVESYLFEFGDGTDSGWQASPVVVHAYALQGELLASLTVRDDRGVPSSNFATATVTVTIAGFRPTATIEDVSPSPARADQVVELRGYGTPVEGARITTHSWNSSIDGHLGDLAEVTVERLSVGSHTIIYKVQDDRGLWSEPDIVELEVLPAEGTWTVWFIEPSDGVDLGSEAVTVWGGALYSAGPVEYVEYRVDNGEWQMAVGAESWTFELDPVSLPPGYHTLRARAFSMGSTSPIAFLNVTVGDKDGGSTVVLGWDRVTIPLLIGIGVVIVACIVAVSVAREASGEGRRRLRGSGFVVHRGKVTASDKIARGKGPYLQEWFLGRRRRLFLRTMLLLTGLLICGYLVSATSPFSGEVTGEGLVENAHYLLWGLLLWAIPTPVFWALHRRKWFRTPRPGLYTNGAQTVGWVRNVFIPYDQINKLHIAPDVTAPVYIIISPRKSSRTWALPYHLVGKEGYSYMTAKARGWEVPEDAKDLFREKPKLVPEPIPTARIISD